MNSIFTIDDTIDDLPLDESQKRRVLEWFARKLWIILEEASGEPDYCGKSYDPLTIDGNVAHSYVFDFEDGQIEQAVPYLKFQYPGSDRGG